MNGSDLLGYMLDGVSALGTKQVQSQALRSAYLCYYCNLGGISAFGTKQVTVTSFSQRATLLLGGISTLGVKQVTVTSLSQRVTLPHLGRRRFSRDTS